MPVVHDPLTGLMNRAALHEIMEQGIKQRAPFALILFDIDRFKLINFGFGDEYGDVVLKFVANAVSSRLRPHAYLGRWAGAQFLCVLPDCDTARAHGLANELREMIEQLSVPTDTYRINMTASFGVAAFPGDGDVLRRLLSNAEAALYEAKEWGRNRVVQASAVRHQVFGMASVVDTALRENRVIPAYQPIVDLASGEIVAEEALARLITTDGDVLAADEFIEVAQKLQLTYKIDCAVIERSCARFRAAAQRQRARTHFVNISGSFLHHPDKVDQLLQAVHKYHAAEPRLLRGNSPLVVEITEREFLGDIASARATLQPLVDAGLQLALDDFGSGYSSFQYLAELPFSYLKIEGSLVRRVQEPKVRSILQGMQNTAADLGLVTLAEGVETGEIAHIVHDLGIDWAQGFHFHRPNLPRNGD